MTLQEIIKRLEPMNLSYVSKETGIHVNALYRLVAGSTDPKKSTTDKLEAFFKGIDNV